MGGIRIPPFFVLNSLLFLITDYLTYNNDIKKKQKMIEETFNLTTNIGELEFEVSGTYNLIDDEPEINYEIVLLKIFINQEYVLIDAIQILNSLDAWSKLDKNIIAIYETQQHDKIFVNIDDIDEDDILGDY